VMQARPLVPSEWKKGLLVSIEPPVLKVLNMPLGSLNGLRLGIGVEIGVATIVAATVAIGTGVVVSAEPGSGAAPCAGTAAPPEEGLAGDPTVDDVAGDGLTIGGLTSWLAGDVLAGGVGVAAAVSDTPGEGVPEGDDDTIGKTLPAT
jgi:hypothetical protein